jgi:sodium-dependent dicarboxylate transporter 2/3/5
LSISEASSTEFLAGDRAAPIAQLSAAEQRFERMRQTAGLFAGPLALLAMLAVPMPQLSLEAHRLSAVVAFVVIWWISEAIPVAATALVGTALMVVLGVAPAQEAFASFANPVIFLFIGSFMIGRAISEHGLDRRLALSLLARPAIRGDLGRIRLALAAMAIGLSAWMSNTATTAMLVPVALGVLSSAGLTGSAETRPAASGFLLVLAAATAAGGLITPVGSPPNLITIGLLERTTGIRLDFFTWMLVMLPIGIVMGLAMYAIGRLMFPLARVPVKDFRLAGAELQQPFTIGQRHCLIAFLVAVVLWIAPGVHALVGDESSGLATIMARLEESVVALVAACLLFVLPVAWRERRFALTWRQADQIDWGTILLFGGGLALGQQMFETGLAEYVGTGIVAITGAESLWGITAMVMAVSIVLTEIASNTASANMLIPVVISICQANGLNPVPPALGACIGASMGFMLPIATPPSAIVYGTGYIRITEMMRFGFVLDIIGFFIGLAGLRIMCSLLGLA